MFWLRLWVWIWSAALALVVVNSAQGASDSGKGEFDGNLSLLRSFYTPPTEQQRNYIFDMWAGRTLEKVLTNACLTDNRALIINSHAKGIETAYGVRHAFYPHEDLDSATSPNYFSVADIANIIGRKHVQEINNIILAGCNREGSFDAAELRQLFPNATNIVHMSSGEAGYQPMFIQLLLTESANIRPIYQVVRQTAHGHKHFDVVRRPAPESTRLSPYMAQLFEPGARQPFRTQIAGRELIDPKQPSFHKPIPGVLLPLPPDAAAGE